MSIHAPRRLGVGSSRGISQRLADAYSDLWRDHGINYELTLSLGIHPKTFDPVDVNKVMKRLVREATHQLRRVPKRQMLGLGALAFAAVLLVELKRRMAWLPEAAWWIGGFFVLFALVCAVARHQHLAVEKETAKQGQRVKSLGEAIERERSKRLD